MATKLDLVLFGATGFTGKLCIKHIVDTYCNDKYSFKFGLAARNMDKLKCILDGFDFEEKEKDHYFELIECDSFNEEQIKDMISKTKTIITAVGPYSVFGEKLIELCSQNGCDYVDLTGEFHWVKQMISKYEKEAIKSKARIVCIAGILASVSDCAIYSAVNKLRNEQKSDGLNENYQIKALLEPCAPLSATESGGSLASIVHMLKQGAFDTFYDEKFPYYLCPDKNEYGNNQPRTKSILPIWNDEIKRYETGALFVGDIERLVFCRSNYLLEYMYGKKPIIYEGSVVFSSKYYIVALLLNVFCLIIPFLLLKVPFVGVLAAKLMALIAPSSGEGPAMDKMLKVKWRQFIFVESVKNKKEKMRVSVDIYGDYLYYNTAKLLVEQGLIFATERKGDKLDSNVQYGFLTPAVAFGDKLIERLNALSQFEITFNS